LADRHAAWKDCGRTASSAVSSCKEASSAI
jgi:hypothetical protein